VADTKHYPLRSVIRDVANRLENLEGLLDIEPPTQFPLNEMYGLGLDGILVVFQNSLTDIRDRLERCADRVEEIKKQMI